MYASVKTAFSSFTNTFEGRIHWMYADVKGLVTTGIGNLIEPVAAAVALPFQHANGVAATAAEITAAWQDIKNNGLTLGAAGANACATRNDLRLTDAAIDNLVSSKLASNETTFLRSFPDFESWPADAQLAGMSMSWALGPAFAPGWPKLSAALKAKDWKAAAANCSISTTGNAGVAPRNVADQVLFTNAAAVAAGTADPSVLYYPGMVPAAAAETSPTGSSPTGSSQTGSSQTGSSASSQSDASSSSQTGSSKSGSSQGGASAPTSGGNASEPTGGGDDTSDEPGSGEDSPSEESDPSSADSSAGDTTESDSDGADDSASDSAGDDQSGDDTTGSSNADSTDSNNSDSDSSGDDSSDTESSGDDTSDTDSSGDGGSGAPGGDSSGSGSSDDDGGS